MNEHGARIIIDLKATIGIKISWNNAVDAWEKLSQSEKIDARHVWSILIIGHKIGHK